MAALNSVEVTALAAGTQPYGPFYGGGLFCIRDTLGVVAGGTTDVVTLLPAPEGYRFMYGLILPSAADATVTLAVGVSGTPAKYRAAATVNQTTPLLFGLAASSDDAMPVSPGVETVIVTAGGAASTTTGYVILRVYAKIV